MLTLFTTPKAFKGHDRVIQTNAVKSWMLLEPSCEIILLGQDEGTAEFASELGIRHIPEVEYNQHGTPLVNSIFNTAREAASNDIICYINSDIILLDDFIPALREVPLDDSLVIGRRRDLDVDGLIDFGDQHWEYKLRTLLAAKGRLHPATGMDFFVFRKNLYTRIPPFSLGRTSWDNWFVFQARFQRSQVIDITSVTTVIHQNHGYGHVQGDREAAFKGEEALENQRMLGGWEYSFNIKYSTKILTPEGLRPNRSFSHLVSWFNSLPVLHPSLKFLKVLTHTKKNILAFSEKMLHGGPD